MWIFNKIEIKSYLFIIFGNLTWIPADFRRGLKSLFNRSCILARCYITARMPICTNRITQHKYFQNSVNAFWKWGATNHQLWRNGATLLEVLECCMLPLFSNETEESMPERPTRKTIFFSIHIVAVLLRLVFFNVYIWFYGIANTTPMAKNRTCFRLWFACESVAVVFK